LAADKRAMCARSQQPAAASHLAELSELKVAVLARSIKARER
jgi:hypothetical protein